MKTQDLKYACYGVYRGEHCLYVGMTSQIKVRSARHRKRFGKDIRIEELERCRTAKRAAVREEVWIDKLKPEYNRTNFGGGGRPIMLDSKRRSITVYLRMTEGEHDQISQEAKSKGQTLSEYIRSKTCG